MKVFNCLTLVICLMLNYLTMHGEIVLEYNTDINSAANQKATALFRERAIETFGWDWCIEHFVLSQQRLFVSFAETEGCSDLFLTSIFKNTFSFYQEVTHIFDIMSERGDTISLYFPVTKQTDKTKLETESYNEFLKEQNERNYYDLCKFIVSSGRESFWTGSVPKYDNSYSDFRKCCATNPVYFIICGFCPLDISIRDEYLKECNDKKLRSVKIFGGMSDVHNLNEKEIELLKKYIILDNEKIRSKPNPYPRYKLGFCYSVQNADDNDRNNILIVPSMKWE